MKLIQGLVFGLYNSRGGTIFYGGRDLEKGCAEVYRHLHQEEYDTAHPEGQERMREIEEWFLEAADLWVPDEFDPEEMHEKDLVPAYTLHPGGLVLAGRGSEPLNHRPFSWAVDSSGCYVEKEDGVVAWDGPTPELEFVPEGEQPKVLKGWSRPRWDDDAFNFVFLKA